MTGTVQSNQEANQETNEARKVSLMQSNEPMPGNVGLQDDSVLPLKIYGPELSYFTGKLEAVVRFMELPYQRIHKGPAGELERATGVAQVPAVKLADDRWMTDTTPMIEWFNERYPAAQVIPTDPVLAFFSRLVEDYADEWLWRPAMHFRWDYAEGAELQGRILSEQVAGHLKLPKAFIRRIIKSRQRALFTIGDGVSPDTWDHVEKIYTDTLAQLSSILETRPFLLGERPSLADFGMFGPAFRHFSQDPTSARIMRETAPAVFEWVARVWNARNSKIEGTLLDHVPDDWGPLLTSIGSAYLPYLCANAQAWEAGQSRFDVTIEGVTYKNIRTAPYRVWCLAELRRHFNSLSVSLRGDVQERLEAHGCWEPLWRVKRLTPSIDPERNLPFQSMGSMTGVAEEDASKMHWFPVGVVKRDKAGKG